MITQVRAAALWLVFALPLAAQELPAPQHTSVNDYAGVLSDDDTRIIDQALIALHDQTGVEGTVVTMTDRARYGGTDGLERFATRLFNHWGVGDADRDDGFMVLLLTDDREARIELGAGYPKGFHEIAEQIVAGDMLPKFRQGDYSTGLRMGTLGAISRIAEAHAAGQPPDVAPALNRNNSPEAAAPQTQPVKPGYFIPAVFGVIFMGFAYLALSFWRKVRGANKCPQCGKRDLITMESPIREELGDGTWRVSQTAIKRSCPNCGWSEETRRGAPQTITYGPGGVVLNTVTHYANSTGHSGRDRNEDRSGRRDRGSRSRDNDRGGGFGGGSSSGGGASGRW